jgi:hypothetical protein
MNRTLIDRAHSSHVGVLDRMIVEFSKYLGPIELDICLDFLEKISDSKLERNWTEEDAATQMKMLLGEGRYIELKRQWGRDNQHLLKNLGTVKYLRKSDNTYWDGLDPEDKVEDYELVYV